MPNAEHAAVVTDLRALEAVIFDLDGVVTRTAELHADAWKRLFDEYLASRAAGANEPYRPFDLESDYRSFVDGKPRYDGVTSFLGSRGIELPFGSPADPQPGDRLRPGEPKGPATSGRRWRTGAASRIRQRSS